MKDAADETTDFAKDMAKEIKNAAKKADEYAKIAEQMVKNWFKKRTPPDYCFKDKPAGNSIHPELYVTPDLIDDQVKEDTEGLIPLIKKYSPIIWLHPTEDYFPITFEEYLTAAWKDGNGKPRGTSIISRKDGSVQVPVGEISFEKMYEMRKEAIKDKAKEQEFDAKDLAFKIEDCTWYGSNPKFYTDKAGNLNTPVYVVTSERNNKIYIQYLTFYGLNGPYDVGPFKGNILEVQNFHESDLEHVTLEFDKATKKLENIYFGSHGRREGFWLAANDDDVEYEGGTHPVFYSAHYGHGLYPRAGTYVRIFGFANDVTGQGTKWVPQLSRIYHENDPRFDPKKMGWMYFPGVYGEHGVGPAGQQSWFMNSRNNPKDLKKGINIPNGRDRHGAKTEDTDSGDIGRDYPTTFCRNPKQFGGGNIWDQVKDTAESIAAEAEYQFCILKEMPNAKIPD